MRFVFVSMLTFILSTFALLGYPGDEYQWKPSEKYEGFLICVRDGVAHGWLDCSNGLYLIRNADGSVGEFGIPPICPPSDFKPTTFQNQGLDLDKIKQSPAYSVNGKECTRDQAIELMESDFNDDSLLKFLTIVGPDSSRKSILTDLDKSPKLTPYRNSLRIQDYSPDSWVARYRGFDKDGIYLQDPNGKILAYAQQYEGPDSLEEFLRRNPSLPIPQPPFGLSWPVVLLGAAGIYFFLRKKQ